MLWITPAILVVAGSGLEGRAVYLRAKGALAGVLIRRAWSETLRTGAAMRPWPSADTHPIACLRIPALGYDEIVLEGASPRTLAFGPARMMCGSAPGEPGNLLIAGHRTSWFLPLRDLRCGDTLVLETLDKRAVGPRRQAYRVETIQVVSPQDVSFLQPTPGDCLTLVTCWPFGTAPRSSHRFVARAEPSSCPRAVPSTRIHALWRGPTDPEQTRSDNPMAAVRPKPEIPGPVPRAAALLRPDAELLDGPTRSCTAH